MIVKMEMFPNATVSSRSSSSRSGHSYTRNSSLPSLRMPNPFFPSKTSFNPLFRQSDAFTSFDASNFVFQEGKKANKRAKKPPSLRRYNSHDSRGSFGELLVESGYGELEFDTTGSKSNTSPESTGDRSRHPYLEAREFLERYSLPRVVRVEDGEPLLLYRCFDSFTKVEAKGMYGKKGKEKVDTNPLYFPEGYSGWFSLTNEKGEKAAVAHSSLLQLVREQVCSFLSIQSFTAYAAGNHDHSDAVTGKLQYLKTQIRGGQVFQLRAVFQHHESGKHSTKTSRVSRSTKDRDLANRYAQLISQTNQELYVPLTTKGEFYEIYSSMKARLCFPGMIDKTGPLAIDKDCLYKLPHLLRRIALPLKVKLISGPLPSEFPKDHLDTFILERKFQEPLMVTCTLPPTSDNVRHELSCINLNSKVRIVKCNLGFDSESRLFKSQRVQAALAFCHKNVESWYREVKLAPNVPKECRKLSSTAQCADCIKLNQRCFENCRNRLKNESNLRANDANKQIITKQVIEKFPKPKKWYRHFKILAGGNDANSTEQFQDCKDPMDAVEKVKSIERYKDMSKLIEDKFGKKNYNPVKKSASFMYASKRIDLEETPDVMNNPALLKCQSLDTQIYTNEENRQLDMFKQRLNRRVSNVSDNLSNDFQMCILENEGGLIEVKSKTSLLSLSNQSLSDVKRSLSHINKIDFDEIKPAQENIKLKKTKPDLIPTLPKGDNSNNSFITERLCSEFYVKTKVQKRSNNRLNMLGSNLVRKNARFPMNNDEVKTDYPYFNSNKFEECNHEYKRHHVHTKSVEVQVHEESLPKTKNQHQKKNITDDIPYSNVIDEVARNSPERKSPEENIYSEICDNPCNCDSMEKCNCLRTKNLNQNFYYMKLGSNGDSVIQSDSDEAIYNTLR